jgi:hypothetical protein
MAGNACFEWATNQLGQDRQEHPAFLWSHPHRKKTVMYFSTSASGPATLFDEARPIRPMGPPSPPYLALDRLVARFKATK